MKIITSLNAWHQTRAEIAGKTIGFVPTMGNLHAGHMSLFQRARQENAIVVASIFINPKQFNQPQDFHSYPRTLEEDKSMLAKSNIDYLFLPSEALMYPDGYEVQVDETSLSLTLEGAHRPGHFKGMLTIVLKLLTIISADSAYFGEKDYQQYLLIKKMATAFFLPTKMVVCPTIRTPNGLALSSRNARLTQSELDRAGDFYRLLTSDLTPLQIRKELTHLGFQVDYIEDCWHRRLGAVKLGEVRLIDNVVLTSTK